MPRARPGVPEPPDDYVSRLVAQWREERPDLPVDPVGVVYRIGRLAAHFGTEIERAFAGSGISGADFAVLAHLRRAGRGHRHSQRELMNALRLTSGTVSVRIGRLARHGLVRRDPDPDDGRGVLVSLTEQGERIFDTMAPVHLANEARMISALAPDEQAELARLLQVLLVEYESPAGPAPGAALGFTATPAHAGHQRRAAAGLPPVTGLLVHDVRPGGPAAASGLQPGDMLMRCGDLDLRSLTCLAQAIRSSSGTLVLEIQRAGQAAMVAIPLG